MKKTELSRLIPGKLYMVVSVVTWDIDAEGIPLLSDWVELDQSTFATTNKRKLLVNDPFFQQGNWDSSYCSVKTIELMGIPESSIVLFLGHITIPQHGTCARVVFQDRFGFIDREVEFFEPEQWSS